MRPTQLQPTRWHGNALPWYEANPARLLLEKRAMETHFPNFQLVRERDRLVWRGTLQSNGGKRYTIALYYPDNFPSAPPDVFPIDPVVALWRELPGGTLKHQYSDGRLCLYYPGDRTFGQNTTAATVVAVAAFWFFAYESWLASGKTEWIGYEMD